MDDWMEFQDFDVDEWLESPEAEAFFDECAEYFDKEKSLRASDYVINEENYRKVEIVYALIQEIWKINYGSRIEPYCMIPQRENVSISIESDWIHLTGKQMDILVSLAKMCDGFSTIWKTDEKVEITFLVGNVFVPKKK